MGPRTPDWVSYSTIAAAALIIIWLLFVPPVAGLANNGDFHKVIGGFSLAGPIADDYLYAPATYTFNPAQYYPFTFFSAEQGLAYISIAVNRFLNRTGTYDIRFIGAVHSAFYLLALWLALPLWRDAGTWRRLGISAIVLVVFCDAMYLVELNSFYMDVPAFLFFVLSVVFACRVLAWRRRRDAWGLVISALLMTVSKAQHVPLGAVMVVLASARPGAFLPGFGRLGRILAPAVFLAAALVTLRATPDDYQAGPLFSQVFYRILPQVKDPGSELRKFGLDDSYLKYVGLYFYSNGVPDDRQFRMEFLKKVSYGRLLAYLLRHPVMLFHLITNGLAEAGRERVVMGNYGRRAGVPPMTECHRFSLWSDFKARYLKEHGVRHLCCVLLVAAGFVGVLVGRRAVLPPGSLAGGVALLAMMFTELGGFIIGDALDFIRHGFLFIAICDTVLVILCVLLIGACPPLNFQALARSTSRQPRPAEIPGIKKP